MWNLTSIFGILTGLLTVVPAGGGIHNFLQTLVQIITFVTQFQPPV